MKSLLTLLTLVCLSGAVACGGGPDVRTDYDKTVDTKAFKSFSFQPQLALEGEGYPPELGPLVRDGARKRMEAKGYTFVELDQSPDLVFDFSLTIKQIKEEKTITTAKPTSPGVGGAIHDFNVPSGEFKERKEIIEYDEGTVRADAINVGGKKLFWECIIVGKLADRDPAKRQERVNAVLDLIFENWEFSPSS